MCDQGIDHGKGCFPWMHPPAHRLLGWATRTSSLKLTREIWRLNQIKGIGDQSIYLKGLSSQSDQETLDRLPTLYEADVLNYNNTKMGKIADIFFQISTGKIIYYLIARTDRRLPGTSRWRLLIERIVDQQPGLVCLDIKSLDDLPIERSSIRQDFLKKSKKLRNQFEEITSQATDRLEGWLEDPPWEEERFDSFSNNTDDHPLYDDWENDIKNSENFKDSSRYKTTSADSSDQDPWV
tara:strand:+ start:235 stop:948 length:714 start_codon:yes stop_codon:yes gene_type:complete